MTQINKGIIPINIHHQLSNNTLDNFRMIKSIVITINGSGIIYISPHSIYS